MIAPDDMRRILIALRVDCDDADSVAADMLRAPRKRQLGPVLHRKNYSEAREKIVKSIAYLLRATEEEPEPGDPSGNGGAGPTH